MESQIHQRLLNILIFTILVLNLEHSKIVPNVAAESTDFSPEIAPSPEAETPDQDLSPTPTSFPPLSHVSFPPSESYSPSDSLPPSESTPGDEDEGISPSIADSPSEASPPFNEFPALPPSTNVDPEIKKICDSTDYPSICLSTTVPFLHGRTDVFSVLETAIQAGNEYALHALSTATKLASTPGIPDQILPILNDCKESYEDILYNFQNAMAALPGRDIGTLNSMLSAVITEAGDCGDSFRAANYPCPLSSYGEKLTNMTSNCLAIVSLLH